MVTVETLPCDTPAIVLDTSAVKELVNERNGVVLRRHLPEDYLQAMKRIEESGMTRQSIRRTVEKYDIENVTNLYLHLYSCNSR